MVRETPIRLGVESFPYDSASAAFRREFGFLAQRAFGDDVSDLDSPLHLPQLRAQSFFLRDEKDRVISYAALLMLTARALGQRWAVGSLSCVMTEPALQGRGHATRVVTVATDWLGHSNLDLGAFTCDPDHSSFYARIGWPVVPGMVLVGNKRPGALRSDALGKAVLLRCFSPRAKENCAALATSTMVFDLPDGEFL